MILLRSTLRLVALALLLTAATSGSFAASQVLAASPNVILIMTDDQGYGDFSCHGNPVLKTPNMDRLYSESVRLTDFHVAPMCSPTRGQLMTGVDAMRNGCTAVCQGRSMMQTDLPTMANYFADSGYTTGHFGKWHLGDSFPHRPHDRGFEISLHHRAWGITSLADYWNNSYFDPVLSLNGKDRKYEGYCTDIFFNESMKWIDDCQKHDRPFFLYLATNTPHVPNVVAESYSKPYRGNHRGKPIPDTFYGMIANLDENLGKLETFLQERKLRDNTILIYLTDNGTQSRGAAEIFNAGMRDRKTSVFEGGHRVPCFIRWPKGKLPAGKNIGQLTQVQDLLPTLIELCGLKADEPQFDGVSLAGLVKGTTSTLADRKLVVQYRVSGAKWDPAVVLWNKWRLVGGSRLYNVTVDPHQDQDIASKHPEVVQAMAAHYDQWYAKAKPMFDQPRWIRVGTKNANPMMLYAQDWTGGYCDNRGGLMQARATGYWNVIVESAGVYQLELRRWPFEAKLPLAGGSTPEGRAGARPIDGANLQIGGNSYTIDTADDDQQATFHVKVAAGKQQLATAFLDENDQTLCSAIYVRLTRLSDSQAAGVKLTPSSKLRPQIVKPVAPRRPASPDRLLAPPRKLKLAEDDIVLADFEQETYGDWKTTGTAFGSGPAVAHVSLPNRITGEMGKRLANSFFNRDSAVGTLTSPPFKIEKKQIHCLVGGGNHAGKTCVNLLIDGKVVRTATGPAKKNAEGRCPLLPVTWNVEEFAGRQGQIEIVDRESGGWGHITVDQIYQSDRAMVFATSENK